jgi:hypothetical protein
MPASLEGQLVVAISSRALFDFEEENQVFEQSDDRAYMKLQLDRLEAPAKPGVAFSLVRKLLAFNDAEAQRVEVVILSRNDPVSGMRVFRSAQHYGLPIQRGSFHPRATPVALPQTTQRQLVFCRPTCPMCERHWALVCRPRRSTPTRPWPQRLIPPKCALLLTVMRCCFPTRLSGFFKPKGFQRFKHMSAIRPRNHCWQALSSHCWPPCTACSKRAHPPCAFAQRSSQPAVPPPTSVPSAR